MDQEEHLTSLEEYMEESYRSIEVHGGIIGKNVKGEADRIVNEINACIPDIVFVCLPAERQIKFMEKYAAMMNTRLCILNRICTAIDSEGNRRDSIVGTEAPPGGNLFLGLKRNRRFGIRLLVLFLKRR